jgi:hypothetical protein
VGALIAIVFLGIAAWFFIAALLSGGRGRDAFRQLAQRYSGTTYRGWLSHRVARFRYGDTSVVAVQHRRRKIGRHTDVWLEWPDGQLLLHIVPTSLKLNPRFLKGMHVLDSADDAFYWRFLTYTNDVNASVQLLNETVKWCIEQLRQMAGNRGLEVRVHRGRLLIRKHCWFRDPRKLDHFIRMALSLFDQMLMTNVVGIDFVEGQQLRPLEDVQCQVCGEVIVTDMVFCRRCKTPHHQECWEYTGVCTVYGCKETDYVTPRVAQTRTREAPSE